MPDSPVGLSATSPTYEAIVPKQQRELAKRLGYDSALLYAGRRTTDSNVVVSKEADDA